MPALRRAPSHPQRRTLPPGAWAAWPLRRAGLQQQKQKVTIAHKVVATAAPLRVELHIYIR